MTKDKAGASIGMQNGRRPDPVSRIHGLPEIPVEDVSSRRSSPRLKATRDKIREQENAVLDVFSQESFFKIGGALVVFLIVFFVFIIGPPER
ncbi:hypothetical protein CVIRNUC_004003 [Coccomyxa viridis]|uniref:Uncharacterized protein n=1 Tax=Coccomyxa viridis TaxID=1274662 RepID=A0AAV1I0K8_9CHLO|nr:hypothetical protein CVIRNUC_004003 [Coccomyxa viridis]